MFKYLSIPEYTLSALLILVSQNLIAKENYAYFDISFDRSINVITINNKVKLSKQGDSVKLNSKGRLWLTGNETRQGFVEILCQNLSPQSVTINFVSQSKPWLEIKTPGVCAGWSQNLLICPVAQMEKGVFCKITEKTSPDYNLEPNKSRLASVNIRAVDMVHQDGALTSHKHYLEKIINYYSAGISLCEEIYPKTDPIVVSWVIFDGGSVGNIEIDKKTDPDNLEVAKCISDNIALWKFPEWNKDSHISYRF